MRYKMIFLRFFTLCLSVVVTEAAPNALVSTNVVCPAEGDNDERLYSMSCDFLLESLYDIEMDALGDMDFLDENGDTWRRKRETIEESYGEDNGAISGYQFARRWLENEDLDPNDGPLFFPHRTDVTVEEDRARHKVCSAMLKLKGVQRRCCSLMSLICPEYETGYSVDPTPKRKSNILEELISGFAAIVNNAFGDEVKTIPAQWQQ